MPTLEQELAVKGCNPLAEQDIIIPNDRMLDFTRDLALCNPAEYNLDLKIKSLSQVQEETKKFITEFLSVHDVIHLTEAYKPSLKNAGIEYIHPLSLPITYIENSCYCGDTEEIIVSNPGIIVFNNISLAEHLTDLSPLSYNHEIIHTQLDSIKGSYQNYLNREVFSVFIEYIYAYLQDPKLLRFLDMFRISEVYNQVKEQDKHFKGKNKISFARQLNNSIYIEGDLKALQLISLFYFSSNQIKKEMLININRVLNGIITVEDYLTIYGISLESSMESKTLKKYLQRVN